jgi:hypothetical protein
MIHVVIVGAIVLVVILPSTMVTFVSVSDRVRSLMPKYAFDIYHRSHPYMVTSSYGLFRKMTGMGQTRKDKFGRRVSVVNRPEIIIEGSYDGTSWSEIHFLYKPGKVDRAPPIVAPHQPRLDWQMWFAALGNYQGAPWFIHLIDKLLEHSPNVIRLLDEENYPFKDKPPNYIRSKLYKYDFTRYNTTWAQNIGRKETTIISTNDGKSHKIWWHRSKDGREYTPSLNKRNPSVNDFLKRNRWIRPKSKDVDILKRCDKIKVVKKSLFTLTNKNLCDLTIYVKQKRITFSTMLSVVLALLIVRVTKVFLS